MLYIYKLRYKKKIYNRYEGRKNKVHGLHAARGLLLPDETNKTTTDDFFLTNYGNELLKSKYQDVKITMC